MRYLLLILVLIFGAACTVEQTNEGKEDDMGFGELDDGLGRLGKSRKGWSASGPVQKGNSLKVVELQADFQKEGASHTTNYTAQFRLIGNPQTGLIRSKPFAEVTWSVEGNQIRRLISIADGTSLQGTGQAVKIKIYDGYTGNVTPLGGFLDYVASVNVVPGTRGSTSNPPMLDIYGPVNVAAAGGSFFFDVPNNAGVTSVAVMVSGAPNVAPGAVKVSQLSTPPLSVLGEYDPRQYFWVPLIPGTNTIVVTNDDPANALDFKVLFGIDG